MKTHCFLIASVFVLAVLCAGLPTDALADIETEMAAAIEDRLNGLIGTEYLPPPISDPTLNAILGLAVFSGTIEGYAFCTPPNLWADPVGSPVPPNNAYGCVNDVNVTVTYVSDVDYTVSIDIAALFIDLSTRRSQGLVLPFGCPILEPCVCNEPSNPSVFIDGEEYILATAGVSGALQITTGAGGCLEASVVPATVQANLTSQVLGIQGDQCLMDVQGDLETYFLDLVADEALWNDIFAQALDEAVAYFNSLCVATEETTWGRIKALYGTGGENR